MEELRHEDSSTPCEGIDAYLLVAGQVASGARGEHHRALDPDRDHLGRPVARRQRAAVMHREVDRANGISEEERAEYKATRARRLLTCKRGKRCSNAVLCPTCSWVRQKKAEDFIEAAYDALGTPGYVWQEIVVSILYDVKDPAEYEVAALRERVGIAQQVRRGVWDELLDQPGAGATYTIERGHGRGRQHGGHVHLNVVYFGPAMTKDAVTRAARAAHARAGRVSVKRIDHDPGGKESGDTRGSKAGVKRVAKYVTKGGATLHYDERVRIADDRALTLDVRFDIASRGTQLGQRLGSCRGVVKSRRGRATQPRTSVPRSAGARVPSALHTEATDISTSGPRAKIATLTDRWQWEGSVFQEIHVPLRDGRDVATPLRTVMAAVEHAAILSDGTAGSINVGLGYLALHFLAGFPFWMGGPDAVRWALLKTVARATRTLIATIDDREVVFASHGAMDVMRDLQVWERAGHEPEIYAPSTEDWTVVPARFVLEDGLISGGRRRSTCPALVPDGAGFREVRYSDATDFEFALAMIEHFVPARLGTTDPERVIEGMVLGYLAEEVTNDARIVGGVSAARARLLPALERVTGWSVVALDAATHRWTYGAHTAAKYETLTPPEPAHVRDSILFDAARC